MRNPLASPDIIGISAGPVPRRCWRSSAWSGRARGVGSGGSGGAGRGRADHGFPGATGFAARGSFWWGSGFRRSCKA
ncbi:hypothetical protein ACTTAF_07635 [Rhodobacter capsulatus]|uniref:hypothetical protein n=1 Tax=Rhodobacter capsulatus TaxID=1061 RepID=UPI004038DE0E